ncbi:MAG: ribosome biogenesis GTPase YlqF [Erysipelotrichaceae bacterium]|nr:ribosome biogenesis GTPase YlqF [Erysipelotrichaceae bacterium]
MEQSNKNIHWFPGHMKKASQQISDKLKLVDFVIVLLDARAPISTYNEYLLALAKNKKKLFLLNKKDLADPIETTKWVKHLNQNGDVCIAISLEDRNSKEVILEKIDGFCAEKQNKLASKGVKNVTSRAMVIGIPNVGKSTFINLMANRKLMGAANTPGFTKSISWAKISKNFELMDTPGILEPKFKDKNMAINLALIGSIKQDILPIEELCFYCLDFLKENYIDKFNDRYKSTFSADTSNYQIIEYIGRMRGLLIKNQEIDVNKSEILILKEFKDGIITPFTLDKI